jgi:hypothetical protein
MNNILFQKTKTILAGLVFLLIIGSFSSCKKAAKVLLISAHPWVVTSGFGALIGDEYTFHDNRLLFITSGSTKIDAKWAFETDGYTTTPSPSNPIPDEDVVRITIITDVITTEYIIVMITETELELQQNTTFGSLLGNLVLTAKVQ